jgi:NADH-quinone oxidoreductase subunit J
MSFLAEIKIAPELVIWVLFGALALGSAIGVVIQPNPVHSALLLVVTLVSVAVLFLVQEAYFLSAVQIIVYTGAVVVLFLFVIMLLGVDKADIGEDKPDRLRPLALILGIAVVVLVMFIVGFRFGGDLPGLGARGSDTPETIRDLGGNVEAIARYLFTRYLLPFEVTALLITAAVAGGIVLARRSRFVVGAGAGRAREVAERIGVLEDQQDPALHDTEPEAEPVSVGAATSPQDRAGEGT